ncbi:RluA family pseudouridine synthase [Paenibacillus doosanensis]|uniref:Pseudouridine synthase n=1 Tax=Paenibacillus konkukensis TaxID=2020716 RepID=A0ABY4RZD1_9BACL|nr:MULTISPECIES: RluA family pseudouridine synthase [Paenibacillus]MCS7458738.1 RluA family pseudouridine synthase [Paenibacillus doosanensis]UQZ86737.1 Ribosomal large subunit pseudouridine synthase D [Paenibacillus konkukensis]
MIFPWQRKGEWLELRLPQVPESEYELKRYLPMSDKFLGNLIRSGGVSVKGTRARLRLFPDESLELMPVWVPIEVLYEDDFLLVVHKPAGMKVHGDGGASKEREETTLADAVASHYASTGQPCKVRHIHRLDEDTTGPVLYAKTEWSQLALDEAMREKRIERRYAAIVQGRWKERRGVVDAPIGRDRHHAGRRRVSATGERAVTHYEVAEQWRRGALVRLRLETGRTHQIRVHLSHLGHPIWGDALYGGPEEFIGRQALHGETLLLSHPFTGEPLHIEAPWPADMQVLYNTLKKI